MSLEKLDRASPDLWPEQSEYFFFGRSLFEIYIHNKHHICSEQWSSRCAWVCCSKFTADRAMFLDCEFFSGRHKSIASWVNMHKHIILQFVLLNIVKNFLAELGNLTMTGLISEVKKLHDLAYQLGLEEAKEMTRGKYLNIFKHK